MLEGEQDVSRMRQQLREQAARLKKQAAQLTERQRLIEVLSARLEDACDEVSRLSRRASGGGEGHLN